MEYRMGVIYQNNSIVPNPIRFNGENISCCSVNLWNTATTAAADNDEQRRWKCNELMKAFPSSLEQLYSAVPAPIF